MSKMSTSPKSQWIDISKSTQANGREDGFEVYHHWTGSLFSNFEILDVGSGFCASKNRMAVRGNKVTTQDIAPIICVDTDKDVSSIPSNSYDVVTAFGVLESVVNDVSFVEDLLRISKKFVIITVSNAHITKNLNPFHCREYTPHQFARFGRGHTVRYFLGTPTYVEEADRMRFFKCGKAVAPNEKQFDFPYLTMLIIKENKPCRDNRFSIILPTIGRPQIKNQLYSVLTQPQWKDGDELIIACDGFWERTKEICDPVLKEFPNHEVRYVQMTNSNDWGHTPRNFLMPKLEGEYCIHLDDDDIMVKNMLPKIRDHIKSKSYVYLYRVLTHDGDYIWKVRAPEYGNVSTQCIIHRLDLSSYGIFEPTIGGDWRFIYDTVNMNYDSVEYKEDLISIFRPDLLIRG